MKRTVFILALLLLPLASAQLELDSIRFDPSIIASGDEVDIIVQFHDTTVDTTKASNPAYTFGITLQPDDELAKEYITIIDASGDDVRGSIVSGSIYVKRFRVKVASNAPAADYEFQLAGQWYVNGKPESGVQTLKFRMPVKREGVQLTLANTVSDPAKIRSGDDGVHLTMQLANTGEKNAKDVHVRFTYPDGITAASTSNNERLVGVVAAQQQEPIDLYLDTSDTLKAGVHNITYSLTYQDTDNNKYTSSGFVPLVIHKRPYIVVTNSTGASNAGSEAHLTVTVQNIGEEDADAVDVRILKQSNQPFDMDVRSDYVGPLKAGETGTATFALDVHRDAAVREHALTVVLRATGDAAEGDTNVYTYTDKVVLDVTGKPENRYPLYALIALIIIGIAAAVYYTRK